MSASKAFHRRWLERAFGRREAATFRKPRQRRSKPLHCPLLAESLESKTLLAVTASVTNSELVISLSAASDSAILRVVDESYLVSTPFGSVGSFNAGSINAIRVVGDATRANQSLMVRPGGAIGYPLTVEEGVDATVIATPIDAIGGVTISSPSITLAANVTTSGPQNYGGAVRLGADITLDAGSSDVVFRSTIQSTVGVNGTLLTDTAAFYRIAINSAGTTLYATDPNTPSLYRAGITASSPTAFNVGVPSTNIEVSPNGSVAYLANAYNNRVTVANTATGAVLAGIAIGGRPEGMTLSPDGAVLYVANFTAGGVNVIDTVGLRLSRTLPVAAGLTDVAVAPDGTWVAACSESTDTVYVIDPQSGAITGTIAVGRGPNRIAASPDGSRLFVVNNYDDSVSIIDMATRSVTGTVPVGAGPTDIGVTAQGRHVYVVNGQGQSVTVIDAATRTVATTVPVGNLPVGIVLAGDGRTAYVANLNSITELGNDPRSLTVRTTGTARFDAPESTVDPLRAFVINAGRRIGPAIPIAEAKGTTLARDSATEHLLVNGSPITFNGSPLSFTHMQSTGFTAIAAANVNGQNRIVWRTSTGLLHHWRMTPSWDYESSFGWQAPGSTPYNRSESTFGIDFDGNGRIMVSTVRGATLNRDLATGLLSVNGTPVLHSGQPVSYDHMANQGFTAVAAGEVNGQNRIVWRTDTGLLHHWRMTPGWGFDSSFGWQAPGTTPFNRTEATFDMDFDGDGRITISAIRGLTFARDVTSGSLLANGTTVLHEGRPVGYSHMAGSGFTAIAAAEVNGQNRIVWRTNTGLLHHWRMTSSWGYSSSFGWQAPGSGPYNQTETAFETDFDGNGRIGA